MFLIYIGSLLKNSLLYWRVQLVAMNLILIVYIVLLILFFAINYYYYYQLTARSPPSLIRKKRPEEKGTLGRLTFVNKQ